MNIPEIAKCPVCQDANTKYRTHCYQDQLNPYDDREPMGMHDEASCGNPKCWMTGVWIPVKQWNRRQPTPDAADERERVYEDLATLLGRTDIQDEDGNHECRWCHDYVEAGSDEGFRHSRDCPFEAMKRAADYFAAHPPKPEPTEAHSKSEFKRLSVLGANVVPPKPTEEWMEEAAREMIEEEMQAAQWVADGVTPPTEEEWVKRHAATIAKHYTAPAEGWQWVPVQSDGRMWQAGQRALRPIVRSIIEAKDTETALALEDTLSGAIWDAMLAAVENKK